MSQAKGSWMRMDENGRAGRRPGVQFGRIATNRIATCGERGADGRQRHHADRVPEARPVAAAERARRAAQRCGYRASRLREVNRILENTAWGSYRTEFYPTHHYKAIGIAAHEKAL
jgi:hypothetical protein